MKIGTVEEREAYWKGYRVGLADGRRAQLRDNREWWGKVASIVALGSFAISFLLNALLYFGVEL